MEPVLDYRDLKVWQMAIDLAPRVYKLTHTLPRSEMYAMGDQMRRAMVSIPSNIAEGHERRHTKEFLHYVCIARGSLAELDSLLLVAERLDYVTAARTASLRKDLGELRRALYGLSSALNRKLGASAA